jgi:hypothetical protein
MSHKNKLAIVLVAVNYYFDPPDIFGAVGYFVHKVPAGARRQECRLVLIGFVWVCFFGV